MLLGHRRTIAYGLIALALLLTSSCKGSDPPPPRDAAVDVQVCTGPRLSILAGKPGSKGMQDGSGETARFWSARGLATDGKYLYVADANNAVLRRVTLATGEVELFAGRPRVLSPWFDPLDGPLKQATFYQPTDLALFGTTLFVGDGGFLRQIDLSAAAPAVATVRRAATKVPWGDLHGGFRGLAVVDQRLYVAMREGVWAFDPAKDELPQLLLGVPSAKSGLIDGDAVTARFSWITALAPGGPGVLYVADRCAVRRVDVSAKTVTTVAGQLDTGAGYTSCIEARADGQGSLGSFLRITGLAFDGKDLWVSEVVTNPSAQVQKLQAGFGSVRRLDLQTLEVTTEAGLLPGDTQLLGELDGPAPKATLHQPRAILADGAGNVYVGTTAAIRKLAGQQVSTLAGRRQADFFIEPGPLTFDAEHLYTILQARGELGRIPREGGDYAPLSRHNFKFFDIDQASGIVLHENTLYVAGQWGVMSRPLAATSTAKLIDTYYLNPGGLAVDGKDLLFLVYDIVEAWPRRVVLRIDPMKPGSPKVIDALGLYHEHEVALVGGGLYVADGTVLARVDISSGKVQLIAGLRGTPGCQDGTGTGARFTQASGLASDGKQLFVGDVGCSTLRAVDLASGVVTTLLGSPSRPQVQEGVGEAASLNAPKHLAYDRATGVLYISDPADDVVLKLEGAECVPRGKPVDAGAPRDAGADAAKLSCLAMLPCVQACPPLDSVCWQTCIAQGTPRAQQLAKEVEVCWTDAINGPCSDPCRGASSTPANCALCIAPVCFWQTSFCIADP